MTIDLSRPSFFADALCIEFPEIDFVPRKETPKSIAPAMRVCGRCLVVAECRSYALADPDLVGIWGGTDTVYRRAYRRALDRTTTRTGPS